MDTNSETNIRAVRRAPPLILRIDLHGPQNRIILSIGVSNFHYLHHLIQAPATRLRQYKFRLFLTSLKSPESKSVRPMHITRITETPGTMIILCRLAWGHFRNTETRTDEDSQHC